MTMMQKSVALLLERYDSRIHLGVARYAGEHRWHLNAHMVHTTELPYGWKGDGLITALDQRADLVDFVRKARIPKVDVSIARPDVRLPRVIGDNVQIGRLAAEHFLERGLRNFAWFAGKLGPVERLRSSAFAECLQSHGFSCVGLCPGAGDDSVGHWRALCDRLGRSLDSIPKPAGVFAFNDYDAANVIDACMAFGLSVPEDVAVLGADNNELVCLCQAVPLSSVNHDLERMGYEAATLLDRLMQGVPAPRAELLIPPRGITVRRSTDTLAINHPVVRKAFLFLRGHIGRSFTVEDVARDAGVSRRALESLFRRELKRSIHDEVLRMRLGLARDCLVNTGLRIADIAAKSGFCHAQHLNNVFKRKYGFSPLKYRKNLSCVGNGDDLSR